MNQKSLKNGRHARLEIMSPTTHFSQYQASSTALGDGDCYHKPYRKIVRQSGGWLYPYSRVQGSMQRLSHNCPPDFSKPLLPVINHNCHVLLNDYVLVNNIYTAWTVNQGHRRWQWLIYHCICGVRVGNWMRQIMVIVSTQVHGILASMSVSPQIKMSILQLTSLKYRDNTMVFVVFIL